jgi:outer membrane immunogenic protein
MDMIRKAAALIASILLVTVPSHADDTSALDTSIEAPAPIWQGAYFGATVGGHETHGTISAAGTTINRSGSGWGGGLYGGYNWRSDALVLGAEGDWNRGFENQTGPGLITLRGRAGWVFDNILIYGTAGVGTTTRRLPINWNGDKEDRQYWGWVVGGGAETMLSRNVSLKGEALYFDAGSESFNLPASGVLPAATGHLEFNEVIYRAGLSYHFN